MISDTLQNYYKYPLGKYWQQAFEFLSNLNENSVDKKYEILGDKMYAMVMSYETKPREVAVLEAHREYIDIQASIVGAEGIEWFPQSSLNIKEKYDRLKDVEFYDIPKQQHLRINNHPGIFTTFFPQDAHLPQLYVDKIELVKKVVVKIHHSLIEL